MSATFESQRVVEHIHALSEQIGPRFSGSPEDRRATEYIRDYFSSLGLQVKEQPFKMTSGRLCFFGLHILEPELGEIPCHPLVFSSEAGVYDIEGELVFLEGFETPQVGAHLTGKIVVWTWPDTDEVFTHFQQLARLKPLAVILLSPGLGVAPLQLQMPARLQKPYLKIPTFFISFKDGHRLFREKAHLARLHVEVEQFEGETCNIIAELPGREFPEEIILIGGHHDSVYGVPGAMDNAAGTAVVMELARLFAQRGSKRTLRFIAWGAEEWGLCGSEFYLKQLKKQDEEERKKAGFHKEVDKTELDRHLFVISVDVAGVALAKDVCFVLGKEDINAVVAHLAKEMGLPHGVKSGYYGTDSLPFVPQGIPSLSYASIVGALTHIMHTPADNLSIIDPAHLQRSGDFLDTFLRRSISEARTWPFAREIPKNLQEEIEKVQKTYDWMKPYEEEESKP